MSGRIFHGVDLDTNYGSLLWNAGDPRNRRRLALFRQFRGYCLRMERELKKGMYVIDRDKRIYVVIDVCGRTIEGRCYWLQRFASSSLVKKEPTEIYPLDWWAKERDRIREGLERVPMWFQVVDAVKRLERKT